MTETQTALDQRYLEAMASIQRAIEKFDGCTVEEKAQLVHDLDQLRDCEQKLTQGRVEIVLFGEISTGKSALINALLGRQVADVDVQGGWTKQALDVHWDGQEYLVPGLEQSRLVLVDTPGINEVGDANHQAANHQAANHQAIAQQAAARGDLILFVTDSDINEIEFSALVALAKVHKPILVVLNKIDLYTPEELDELVTVLRDERLADLIIPENLVLTAADPREVEVVRVDASGREQSQWRKPPPQVESLKVRILEILDQDGLALMALNAAMFAADKTDRIARLRVQLRNRRANQTIGSFAALKAIAVALNPFPVADVLGGTSVDASMVVTLAHLYGLQMSWMHAQKLARSILWAAGWIMAAEAATHVASVLLKSFTLGAATPLTAIPQGAAAGYGSYVVGHAAKYYFEHGASWGNEAPKKVVRRILDNTDKASVLEHLKAEIRKKIHLNVHSQ